MPSRGRAYRVNIIGAGLACYIQLIDGDLNVLLVVFQAVLGVVGVDLYRRAGCVGGIVTSGRHRQRTT